MATFNIDAFFSTFNNRLDAGVKNHLKNVYSCLAISTLAAAAGGYIHLFTNILQGSFLTTLISLGFLIALCTTHDNGKNQHIRISIMIGFAFFTGLGMGPLLDMVIAVDPAIVSTAFLATCAVFTCFSLSALYAEQGRWLFIGGTLMSVLSMMSVLALANLFFGSYMLFQMHLYLGLLAFCGFVLYDTQIIIEKRRRGDKDYVSHSIDLFIDFIGIFRRLLIILAQKEGGKREKKRN